MRFKVAMRRWRSEGEPTLTRGYKTLARAEAVLDVMARRIAMPGDRLWVVISDD